MNIEFSNLHCDGDIRSKWDVLLRIVGDFTISINGRIVYQESEFCLVEFGAALAKWLVMASDLGPDFVYTSLESETEGLVRFTRIAPGIWRVSAAYQKIEGEEPVTTADLKFAAAAYIRNLESKLPAAWGILPFIDDAKARNMVEQMLRQ